MEFQTGDTIALNLLYIQAVSDMERGWTLVVDRAIERQLSSLQSKQSKKEVII
jgi:sorting nexin-17